MLITLAALALQALKSPLAAITTLLADRKPATFLSVINIPE